MNTFKIFIGGVEYTDNVPFPIKWNELLDEQLDEASLTLFKTDINIFKPLTEVKIEIYSNNELKHTLDMLVVNDKSIETPAGSYKYNHELYLIELTKWLEGFMCRSQGYVNPIGRIFTDKKWDGSDINVS